MLLADPDQPCELRAPAVQERVLTAERARRTPRPGALRCARRPRGPATAPPRGRPLDATSRGTLDVGASLPALLVDARRPRGGRPTVSTPVAVTGRGRSLPVTRRRRDTSLARRSGACDHAARSQCRACRPKVCGPVRLRAGSGRDEHVAIRVDRLASGGHHRRPGGPHRRAGRRRGNWLPVPSPARPPAARLLHSTPSARDRGRLALGTSQPRTRRSDRRAALSAGSANPASGPSAEDPPQRKTGGAGGASPVSARHDARSSSIEGPKSKTWTLPRAARSCSRSRSVAGTSTAGGASSRASSTTP